MSSADSIATLIAWQEGPAVTRVSFIQPQHWPGAGKHANGMDISWAGVLHGGDGGNYGFADGHAKFAKRNAVTWAMFGFSGIHWDGKDGSFPPNTATLHLQNPATENYWYSCGTIDISATSIATGGDVCG